MRGVLTAREQYLLHHKVAVSAPQKLYRGLNLDTTAPGMEKVHALLSSGQWDHPEIGGHLLNWLQSGPCKGLGGHWTADPVQAQRFAAWPNEQTGRGGNLQAVIEADWDGQGADAARTDTHEFNADGEQIRSFPWEQESTLSPGTKLTATGVQIRPYDDAYWNTPSDDDGPVDENHDGPWHSVLGGDPSQRTAATDLLRDPHRVDPDYFTGIHEMGHVLDNAGVTDAFGTRSRARERLTKELTELFVRTHQDHIMNWSEPERVQNFGAWLRNSLPGGAFQGNPDIDSISGMNVAEGLAHAFTQVELNPENASDVAKTMHKILIEESRPETSQLLRERMNNSAYAKTWQRKFGPYPGYKPATTPPAPTPLNIPKNVAWDLPYGFSHAIDDVRKKYPQAPLRDVGIDEKNTGGVAFVTPEQRTGFEPGKPSVVRNAPRMDIERRWAEADLPGWNDEFDKMTDTGHFPRWESTTAGEPWPEDAIEDAEDEFNQPKRPGYVPAVQPPKVAYSTNTDDLEMSMSGTPGDVAEMGLGGWPEKVYDLARFWLDYPAYVKYKIMGTKMLADPDGLGVWRITANPHTGEREMTFLPVPGTGPSQYLSSA